MPGVKGKVVSYTYVKPINQKYIQKLSLKSGNTLSDCMDAILDSHRLQRPIKLKDKKPQYVKKAETHKLKKAKKMQDLNTKAVEATKKKAAPKKKTAKKVAAKKLVEKATQAKKVAPAKKTAVKKATVKKARIARKTAAPVQATT